MRCERVFIAAFLVIQVALPLRYYLSGQSYDERFAWRMYSAQRMSQCQVSFSRDGEALVPEGLHTSWAALLKRGRGSVVEAWGQRLCREESGVVLNWRCVHADGERRWVAQDQPICEESP